MTISTIIIAKNAAATIARALNSVAFTDEQIVIVDASTKDQTAAIAARLGAQVHIVPWQGYGPQKNTAAAQAHGAWLLFIDDDEEVTPALAEVILKITNHKSQITNHKVYWLRIVTIFLGRRLNHLYGHNPRLFKKSAARWTDSRVHEQVVLNSGREVKLGDNTSGLITKPLLHYSHPDTASYLRKMHHYTTLDARQMYSTNRHRSGQALKSTFWLPHYLAFKQFIKLYFYRRGFLDGYAGFKWCVLSSYYEYEMGRKYTHLKKGGHQYDP